MTQPTRHVRAKVICDNGHDHDVCVPVSRGVPPELLCGHDSHSNFGGAASCRLPGALEELVERELRDRFQEFKRLGFVLVRAI
ncbi:hypothetical protein [Agromyces sp. NPDC049794]|uniref:hypothetical protein n=1 Tax=unclassified Agromyces TaxID=2639701 RepID=UPI0033C8FE64